MSAIDETEFTNAAVAASAVPDYVQVQFEPLAPGYRRYTLFSTLSHLVPLLVAMLFAWIVPFIPVVTELLLVAVGLVLVALAVGVYRWIEAGYRGWALREHDIIARAGLLWRNVTALPVARIQHVETTHGPLERAHGLARLKLYTAGGLTADLVIIGLSRETSDRLREYLVEQIRRRDSTTVPAGDDSD